VPSKQDNAGTPSLFLWSRVSADSGVARRPQGRLWASVPLHNYLGGPLIWSTINDEFNRVLCKTYKGRVVNDTGLASFSIHRLRHTLASNLSSNGADTNTIMTCLGWVSPASIEGYTKLDENAKIQGFIAATAKVEQQLADGFGKRVLTSDEFLLLAGEEAA
jgi:hypothetical protein